MATEPDTGAAAVPPRRGRRHRDLWVALAFVAPALLAAVVLRVWPMVRAVTDSLHSTPLGFGPTEWVGLEQYRALLGDPAFLNSLVVTAVFGVVINPLQVLLALALALLLNARLPATGLMRTLIFLPVAVPQSVSAVIWAIAYRPDGPLNGTLALFGLDGLRYLTSPGQALPSLMVIVSWIGVGYWMMFLIAGLKEIDPTLYEAAQIDGAGRWRQLVSITIPQLRRQLIFVLVADTISNLLVFAPVQILTNGGPNGRTDLIMNNIFERAYVAADTGSAAAATVILVVVALAIVVVQFRLLGTGEED
ncbi:ABC transporter permease subunit [Auraticoccus sp. F435]|uniref:ABC transporter permease subunit n=1 Tax=Auraticoccus cholistanensis TaxID=2656650 RepID=A0A6A9UXZ3_9ACTN|nr:ABC transporter permease subunit [Auraticoccus cholistanensis]